jgi:4-hydroxy-tetrahydrodipicolinate reductase
VTDVIVCGAAGRMGQLIIRLLAAEPHARLVGAVEAPGHTALGADAGTTCGIAPLGVTVAETYAPTATTVTLDFTAPAAALAHIEQAAAAGGALVVGTTGFDADERARAEALARRTRAVIAPNMSIGITVLDSLVAAATKALGTTFDIEVVEIHHRLKRDAPSGTALKLGETAAAARGGSLRAQARFGREGEPGPRTDDEIGVFGVRGGDAIGDHTVYLIGAGERLELTHRAQSRECLAAGAVRAALWVAEQPVGLYSMRDVLALPA